MCNVVDGRVAQFHTIDSKCKYLCNEVIVCKKNSIEERKRKFLIYTVLSFDKKAINNNNNNKQ